MDSDPNSALNRAHTKEREAEDDIRAERFDSAITSLESVEGECFLLDSNEN